MTEAEATEEVPTATEATEAAPADQPKPTPVPRPDRKAVDKATQALNSKIEGINAEIATIDERIEDIKKQIDTANESRSDEREEVVKAREVRDELRARLEAIRSDRDALQSQFEEIRGKVDSAIETSKSARTQLKFRTVEDIDKEITRLDRQQSTTSMSLAEEKRIVKEIEQLKTQKRQLASLGQSQEQITRDKDEKTRVSAALKAKRDEFGEVVEQLNAQRAVLDELTKTDDSKKGKIPTLIEERRALYESKKEAVARIREVQKEIKDLWDDFKAKKKEWEVWKDEERKQYEVEKKARLEERLKREEEEELKKVPYEEEMALCDYLVHYLKTTFLAEAPAAGAEESKSNGTAPDVELDGLKAFKRDDEDDDPWARKKKGGAKKGKGKAKDHTIVHSPDTLASYALIQLTAPTRVSTVAASIEELKAKKAWYSVQPRPPRKPIAEQLAKETEEGEEKKEKKRKPKAAEFRSTDEDFPTLGGAPAKPTATNGTAVTEEPAEPADS